MVTNVRAFVEARADDERARQRLRAFIANDLPHPHQYAVRLPDYFRDALMQAYRRSDGSYYAMREHAKALASMGLAEARGACLTVFGMQVRQAIAELAS